MTVEVSIKRTGAYKFEVDFGAGMPRALADLPPPLGGNTGPSPEHLLAAAIANCLSASLVFALGRYKEDPGAVTARVSVSTARNAEKRLRVSGMAATITLAADPATLPHLTETLARFEEHCTVTESVRAGVPVAVTVVGPDGAVLRAPAA